MPHSKEYRRYLYLKISARTPTQKESNKIPKIQPVAVQLEIFTFIYTVYIQSLKRLVF